MTVSGEGGFFGSVVLYLAGTLSSAAGVGGGALNVPILYNIFGFSYHEAVVLSLCTLMGNYILQVMLNIDKRHPSKPGKPLIYWDAVLILLPAELGGSNLGVILSSIVPDTILYLFAMVVLMIAGALTLSKALDYFEKETHVQKELDDSESLTPLMLQQAENGKADDDSVKKAKKPIGSTLASIIPDYLKCCCKSVDEDRIVITDQIEIPWLVVEVVLGFWLFYAICYIVMKQFDTCEVAYLTILAGIYSLLFAEIVWGLNYLMAEQKMDPESIAEGDIHWGATAWFLPLIAFGVGILTSLLGIGGGELMGPLMLRMKILPLVSSGTTSIMSLLNTSSTVIHYMIMGDINWDYAPGMFLIGAAAGFSGRITGLFVSSYYGRPSVLVFALFAVLVICFIIYVVYIFVEEIDVTFGNICLSSSASADDDVR